MITYNPSEIVDQLKKGGKISQNELNFVRKRLCSPSPDDDIYDLIRVLGLATRPTPEDVQLVEKYFKIEEDDWILQGAIYALCNYWKLTKNYLDLLCFFIQIENWDDYSSAAIASFGALGNYLFETKDAYIISKLLDLYDKDMKLYYEGAPEYHTQHLASLYKALDITVCGRDALRKHIKIKIPQDIDEKIIAEAVKLSK